MTAGKQGKKTAMTKDNLQPISELMTSALAPIHTHLNQMDKRLDAIETRLDSMAEDITAIKEDAAVTRTACNTLIKWNEHTSAVVQVPYLFTFPYFLFSPFLIFPLIINERKNQPPAVQMHKAGGWFYKS